MSSRDAAVYRGTTNATSSSRLANNDKPVEPKPLGVFRVIESFDPGSLALSSTSRFSPTAASSYPVHSSSTLHPIGASSYPGGATLGRSTILAPDSTSPRVLALKESELVEKLKKLSVLEVPDAWPTKDDETGENGFYMARNVDTGDIGIVKSSYLAPAEDVMVSTTSTSAAKSSVGDPNLLAPPVIPPRSTKRASPSFMRSSPLPSTLIRSSPIFVSHSFRPAKFSEPRFCLHCSDYSWGAGRWRSVLCVNCGESFHSICAPLTAQTTSCVGTAQRSSSGSSTHVEDGSVESWGEETVVRWMTAVNLHCYIDHFRANISRLLPIDEASNKVGGALRRLDADILASWRIVNNDHRAAILVSVDALFRVDAGSEGETGVVNHGHRLRLMSFIEPRRCDHCGEFLLGIVKQGLSCDDCGLCFHRACAATGVSPCRHDGAVVPIDYAPPFGVALTDLDSEHLTPRFFLGAETDSVAIGVPIVVVLCCSELERRSAVECTHAPASTPVASASISNLFRVYSSSLSHADPPPDLRSALSRCRSVDEPSCRRAVSLLSSVKLELVAACLHRYLLQLPAPVIPVEVYAKLIDRGRNSSAFGDLASLIPCPVLSGQSESSLTSSLLCTSASLWPSVHRCTLRFLMRHLCRVWTSHAALRLSGAETPTLLLTAFSPLMLAPSWNRSADSIVEDRRLHAEILERLMVEMDWGDEVRRPCLLASPPPPPRPSKPTASKPRATSVANDALRVVSSRSGRVASSGGIPDENQRYTPSPTAALRPRAPAAAVAAPLGDRAYYFGAISREEANSLVESAVDGTFLIRDSTRKPEVPYALHVRYRGAPRPIQILKSSSGKWGFAEEFLIHDSVPELVAAHAICGLEMYNPELKVKLLYPLDRNERGSVGQEEAHLASNLEKLHTLWLIRQNDYEEKLAEHGELVSETRRSLQSLEAFRQTASLYEQQVEVHRRMAEESTKGAERQAMGQTLQVLERSLEDVRLERQKLSAKYEADLSRLQRLAADVAAAKPELGRLAGEKIEAVRRLSCVAGWDAERVERLFRSAFRALWFSENMRREDAGAALKGKPDGTFVLRRSKASSKFALSLVHRAKIFHAQIERLRPDGSPAEHGGEDHACFGFDKRVMFPSLDLLVQHFHQKSLKDHNPQLDTRLKYPLGYFYGRGIDMESFLGSSEKD